MATNVKWDRTTEYFDIDGVLLVGERDATGKPKGMTAMGNVVSAKITQAVTTQKHKERQSGQRGTDIDVEQELETGIEIVMENAALDMLELALRGGTTRKIGATVTDEAIKLYNGAIVPLANMKVSAVASVERGAQALVEYVDEVEAWDYRVNLDHGSIEFNDGSSQLLADLTTGGTAPTVITVGYPTRVTVANTAAVGEKVAFSGFTGADAALINGKAHKILAATSTYVDIDLDTTGKTITLGTPLSAFDGVALTVTYTYTEHNRMDALTTGAPERYLRLEGLNRRNDLAPIVVDVFKFSVSPAQEFSLLGDENALVQQFTLTGSLLNDPLQATGSKYYAVRK